MNVVLKNNTNPLSNLCQIILTVWSVIQQNLAFCGVIQAGKQFNERGFTRSIVANNGNALSRLNCKTNILKYILFCAGVAKGDVLKPNACLEMVLAQEVAPLPDVEQPVRR